MSHDRMTLARFSEALAEAVAHIGEPDFMSALDSALAMLVHFDNSMVFAYKSGERPKGVYTDIAPAAEVRIIVDQYLTGPYLLDPYFAEVRKGRATGLAYLGDIAPDSFFETEYYEQHYRQTRITDEAGFFVGLPDGTTVVHSVTRRNGAATFAPGEVQGGEVQLVTPGHAFQMGGTGPGNLPRAF